ncbi:MAG: hypothetical protein KAR31_09225, partial [Candidatus Omnitrophica bacterium]|nr:hypothetical protein [Candidatus Omnitrophota bacterium]
MTNETPDNKPMDAVEKLNALSKKKRTRIFTVAALVFILAATFVAYLPTLSNDFIYLDDDSHLLNNPDLRVLDFPHLKRIFTTTINTTYIPLTLLSFAFEYHFAEYDPFIYHLNNLLLHLGVTALVFVFAMQIGLPLCGAFAGALLFGLHPIHVESVCWITERKDVLYAFFYMGALCFYWMYLSSSAKKGFFYAAAIVCGILSMLAKPMALSLPLVMLICDWFKGRRWGVEMLVDKAPHFLYIVPLTWLTLSANTGMVTPNLQGGVIMWIWTFVFYIYKFLLPVSLVPRYEPPDPVTLANPQFACALGLFVLIMVALVRWRRHRWLMFASLFYFFSIFMLLRANTVVDDDVVADRFMYLPCLGICFLIGYGIDRLMDVTREKVGWRMASVACLVAVTVWLGAKTFVQTKVWRASIPFWTFVAENYPANAMSYGNRGEAYR